MIFDYLNIASYCFIIYLMILLFSKFRSYNKKIFGKKFEKKFYKFLFQGSISNMKLKYFLRNIGIIALIFSITGLKTGVTVKPVERKGVDIIFCVDVSLSMNAEDIKPSRLNKVKFELTKIIENLEGDRVGIVVFSGSNFLYLPLTMDYDAAKLFTKSIDTDMISSRGTEISSAIQTSLEAFSEDGKQQKIIFLLSDGEDHGNNSLDSIKRAIKDKVNIFVVAVGSSKGSLIPDNKKQKTFIYDDKGQLVISKVNLQFLDQLAKIGKGRLIRISKSEPVSEEIIEIISQGENALINSFEFSEFEQKFQYPLVVSIIMLVISSLIPAGRFKWKN